MDLLPERTPIPSSSLSEGELRDAWPVLDLIERSEGFRLLSPRDAERLFLEIGATEQARLLRSLEPDERRLWVRLLAPDDAADVVQELPAAEREAMMSLLDSPTRREVTALLAYAEDAAGGLMNPRFVRVRPEMTVDEAIRYVREQARDRVTHIDYLYVLDPDQRLLGQLPLRELFAAGTDKQMRELMRPAPVTVREHTDQELVAQLFARHNLLALPVLDDQARMKGVVTVDDAVDVVAEEATEDIQKYGGQEALEAPYLRVGFFSMVKKRAGWLSALFLGEMLTATAMSHFEDEIARAVVLALFVPLIISSGGNSGSQASTLVIRAMALGELRLRDWWRVSRRELASGLVLGSILGTIGVARIALWHGVFHAYGSHWLLVALTVGTSLVGVVTFGTLAGSTLPLFLHRMGFDPANASAPFVATLVDVTGLIIYFSVASFIMGGTLL
jgi:magnesium transporter